MAVATEDRDLGIRVCVSEEVEKRFLKQLFGGFVVVFVVAGVFLSWECAKNYIHEHKIV